MIRQPSEWTPTGGGGEPDSEEPEKATPPGRARAMQRLRQIAAAPGLPGVPGQSR
jgi:hypothetical protein